MMLSHLQSSLPSRPVLSCPAQCPTSCSIINGITLSGLQPRASRLPCLTPPCAFQAAQYRPAEIGFEPLTDQSVLPAFGKAVQSTLAALLLTLASVSGAAAENVRVEDVDNPALQAGLEAANERRFDDAERFFKIVLSKDRNSASAWSNLGNAHLSQGKATEALSDFSNAVELASNAPVPYLNRALANEQLGVEAERNGNAAQAADRFQDAIHDCDSAIERDGREFAAWFNRGNVEARLKQYDQALASYRKAADLAPGIADGSSRSHTSALQSLYAWGLAGYRLREAELMYQIDGHQQDASRMMRAVTRKNPSYAEAHAALAAAEWQAGHREAAEEHFATANTLDQHWSDPLAYIKTSTKWPPRLVAAMQSFLAMSVS